MKLKTRLLVASALAAIAGTASATTCDSALSSYAFYASIGDTYWTNYIQSNHPECFGGSATNSLTQINSTAFYQMSAVSSAMTSRFLNTGSGPLAAISQKGMAAGGTTKAWNVWGNLGENETRQGYNSNNAKTHNSADVLTTVIGADYALNSNTVLGISASFDDTNGSGKRSDSTDINSISAKGYSIAPYIGYQINRDLAVDASLGFGKGELQTKGNNSAIKNKADAERLFFGANLNYAKWLGNLQLLGKVSYLHGEEDYDNMKGSDGTTYAQTGAKNTIDQARMNLQAGYWLNGVMPYLAIGYTSDLHRETTLFGASTNPIGKNAWTWGLGANFFSLANGITGGIAYQQEEGRSHQKNNTFNANISLRF